MNSAKSYQRHCSKCEEDTLHVPVHRRIKHVAIKTLKIIVFCVSFGVVYPHIFTEDEVMVTCEKCGTQVAILPE